MTPESVERAIQFILEHQARYEESLGKTQQQIQKTQQQLEESTKQASERSVKTDAQIAALAVQSQVTSEQIRELKEVCEDLLDHGRRTNVRLDRLENPER